MSLPPVTGYDQNSRGGGPAVQFSPNGQVLAQQYPQGASPMPIDYGQGGYGGNQMPFNTGALGASQMNYGGQMQGAMGMMGNIMGGNADRALAGQQAQVPVDVTRLQQQGLNQRMGMMTPLLAMLLGRSGAGGQGGGQNGFFTNYGQMASGGGPGGYGGGGASQGGMGGAGSPGSNPNYWGGAGMGAQDLYHQILQQRMANEVNLNSFGTGHPTYG